MIRTAAGLMVAVAALTPGDGPAQSAAISVHGWIEDESGRPVPDVAADEIEVSVDGTRVALASVAPRSLRMSLVILIDKSRSVSWDARALGDELDHFAGSLQPTDRVMLTTVGGRPFSMPFRNAGAGMRQDVQRAAGLDREEGYGATPIWDALHRAVTILAAEPAPRSILLLTDGQATGNRHGLAEVADHAMANAASIHVIALNAARRIRQRQQTEVIVQPAAPLQGLTAYTGGQISIYPQRQKEAARLLLSALAANLKALHEFRFSLPRTDGVAHRLEIRVKRPRMRVHAPMAFVAPGSS